MVNNIIPILLTFVFSIVHLYVEKKSNLSYEEQLFSDYWMYSESVQNIKLVEEQVFGDTKEIFLGTIWDVDVDSKGRVYIADGSNVTIHVFNPDGNYSGYIGQQGRGPGEFINITQHTQINIKSNKIYVTGTDWIFSDKVQVFSLHDYSLYELSEVILFNDSEKKEFNPALENYFPRSVYPLENEQMLVAYEYIRSPEYLKRNKNKILYILHDQNGSIITGPVLEQKDRTYLYKIYEKRGYNYYAFPFFGKSLIVVAKDGLLYTAFSDEFNIEVRTLDGEILRIIEHPFDNLPLTRRELIRKYENMDMSRLDFNEGDNVALQMIREAENLPEFWPALNDLLIDDENRLWVSTVVEDFDVYEWWVLEETGELISKFEWPRDEPIEAVKNGYIYTRETDEETGLQQIVRYRIELEEV
jgi:hypothetical protein